MRVPFTQRSEEGSFHHIIQITFYKDQPRDQKWLAWKERVYLSTLFSFLFLFSLSHFRFQSHCLLKWLKAGKSQPNSAGMLKPTLKIMEHSLCLFIWNKIACWGIRWREKMLAPAVSEVWVTQLRSSVNPPHTHPTRKALLCPQSFLGISAP